MPGAFELCATFLQGVSPATGSPAPCRSSPKFTCPLCSLRGTAIRTTLGPSGTFWRMRGAIHSTARQRVPPRPKTRLGPFLRPHAFRLLHYYAFNCDVEGSWAHERFTCFPLGLSQVSLLGR